MQSADLAFLYRYNEWANRRILRAAAGLTPEQFLAATGLSWGSVRDVLTHALGGRMGLAYAFAAWRSAYAPAESGGLPHP